MPRRKEVFAINRMEVDALLSARHDNPHHLLGIHECIDDVYVNVFLPDAKVVTITDITEGKTYSLISDKYEGFFSIFQPTRFTAIFLWTARTCSSPRRPRFTRVLLTAVRRPALICWFWLTTEHTGFLLQSAGARITTGHITSRKNSFL